MHHLSTQKIIAWAGGRPGRHLLAAAAFVLFFTTACSRGVLPEAPAFENLGFADSLDAVYRQVRSAYDDWEQLPDDAYRNGHLGMLLYVYGKYPAAEVFYQRARLLAPAEFRWIFYHALTLSKMGHVDAAVEAFRKAYASNPEDIETRLYLADTLLQVGDVQQSHDLFASVTEQFPNRVEGWLGLGKVLNTMGNSSAAVAALRRAAALGPEFGEIHYALALALRASGDNDGSRNAMDTFNNTQHSRLPARDPLVQALNRMNVSDVPQVARASRLLEDGQLEEAATYFRAAVTTNPANQDAWGGLVDTLIRLGRLDQAGESYRAALAAGISYRRLHLIYGRALMRAQQLDAAHSVIGKAIELDPQYAAGLLAMGELELKRNANMAAIEHFRRALVVAPNNRRIHLGLARALNADAQYEEAAALLEPLASDPKADTSYALKELGFAYYNLGREDEAIKVLQRGRQIVLEANDTNRLRAFDAMLGQLEEFGFDVN